MVGRGGGGGDWEVTGVSPFAQLKGLRGWVRSHLSANQSFVFDRAQEPMPLQVPFGQAKLHAITFVICMVECKVDSTLKECKYYLVVDDESYQKLVSQWTHHSYVQTHLIAILCVYFTYKFFITLLMCNYHSISPLLLFIQLSSMVFFFFFSSA